MVGISRTDLERALASIPKEELVRIILEKAEFGEDGVPISIFTTELSPLEAITRYLREQGKRLSDIAKVLHKQPASVSQAWKHAQGKKFTIEKTDVHIPISVFSAHPSLSVLEVIVYHLREQGQKFTDIATMLGRNPKTIWTLYKRAEKKNA